MQLLDPETRQEKTLAQERCISGFYLTDNGRILAASYETYRDNIKGFQSNTGNRDICYTQKGTEPLSIFCIDLKSGKKEWRTVTSCTQNCNICLSGDLEIESADRRKVCLASAGSHMEILAQDTGECLYTYDLPGLPVSWRIAEGRSPAGGTGESLVSALRDGSQVFYRFGDSVLCKYENVLPDQILQAKEAVLLSSNGEMLYRRSDTSASTRIHGIGFRQKDLFLLEEEDFDLHFRIPEKEIDIVLPAGKNMQYVQNMHSEKEYFSWDLPNHKLLLQYGMQSFIFDPETGITEAIIDNMLTYNPQTDTMLLIDNDGHIAIFSRNGWEDLAEKGRRILGE